jgi:hypothetical protein
MLKTPPLAAVTPGSGLKRSISAAALTGRMLEADITSALESGLLADSDVNVYGMRTPWHGAPAGHSKFIRMSCFQWKGYHVMRMSHRLF